MDYTLLNILREMTAIERYKKNPNSDFLYPCDSPLARLQDKKKPRFKGIVKEKKYSKKGNIILIIKKQKYEEAVLVNKNKTDLFEIAERLKPKDEVYVEGEKGINIIFCDRLKVLKRNGDGEQRL